MDMTKQMHFDSLRKNTFFLKKKKVNTVDRKVMWLVCLFCFFFQTFLVDLQSPSERNSNESYCTFYNHTKKCFSSNYEKQKFIPKTYSHKMKRNKNGFLFFLSFSFGLLFFFFPLFLVIKLLLLLLILELLLVLYLRQIEYS